MISSPVIGFVRAGVTSAPSASTVASAVRASSHSGRPTRTRTSKSTGVARWSTTPGPEKVRRAACSSASFATRKTRSPAETWRSGRNVATEPAGTMAAAAPRTVSGPAVWAKRPEPVQTSSVSAGSSERSSSMVASPGRVWPIRPISTPRLLGRAVAHERLAPLTGQVSVA